MDDLKKGIVNLERHIENMQKYTKNIVVYNVINLGMITKYYEVLNKIPNISDKINTSS